MEAAVMADHFDSINKLPEGVPGVPNWRCVPGYQVLLNFTFRLMLMLVLIMRLKMLNPNSTHSFVPNWRCVPGYQQCCEMSFLLHGTKPLN